jgi:histidine triad (HIT) family protein
MWGILRSNWLTRDALRMDSDTPSADCFVCTKHALGDGVPGGVLFENDLVYAGHAYPLTGPAVAYRGYLVAEPKRHAAGLGNLTDSEASALGLLVNRLARALMEVADAEHVYSFVFGDGLAHLHVVLAPRYPDTPREYWGVRLREWPEAPRVAEDEMRSLVARLRAHVIDA